MSSHEAVRAGLYRLGSRGAVPGLDPMRIALAARGDPHARFRPIHVAGTNGKGSVSAIVSAALTAAGRLTGLYTSPHLHRMNERIRLDGEPVDDARFDAIAARLLSDHAHGKLGTVTFFEMLTLLAWEVFAETGVEEVVLEVGLGGRLDATNVCTPRLCAITRIALDHEAWLGSSITEIAREKAGILKPGVPCVLGPSLASGEAREAIEAVAREIGAPLVDAGRARWRDASGTSITVEAGPGAGEYPLGLAGDHQLENAATAVAVATLAGVAHADIAAALASVRWPARLERIEGVLLDAAHNPDGIEALLRALPTVAPEAGAVVFGVSSDKQWARMLDALVARFPADRRFYTAARLDRALRPERLDQRHAGRCVLDPWEALERARDAAGDSDVVVCGSIFVVSEVRARLLGIPHEPPIGL